MSVPKADQSMPFGWANPVQTWIGTYPPCIEIQPGRLTWNLRIHPWKKKHLRIHHFQVLCQSSGVYCFGPDLGLSQEIAVSRLLELTCLSLSVRLCSGTYFRVLTQTFSIRKLQSWHIKEHARVLLLNPTISKMLSKNAIFAPRYPLLHWLKNGNITTASKTRKILWYFPQFFKPSFQIFLLGLVCLSQIMDSFIQPTTVTWRWETPPSSCDHQDHCMFLRFGGPNLYFPLL